jgi:hypothetical protein
MKITVNTTEEREIEIPKFFRIGRDSYKLSSNNKYVTEVTPCKGSYESIDLGLFPTIRIDLIRYVSAIGSGEIIPITEQEFEQDAYQVITEMEKLMEL